MAFKDFSAGEVLTAADVDNLLMRQTVMVFADATARTTALSAVLAQGMITYRTDGDIVEQYDGSVWSPVGTDSFTTTGTAGYLLYSNGASGVLWANNGTAGQAILSNGTAGVVAANTISPLLLLGV
jgi:hypothetical protein